MLFMEGAIISCFLSIKITLKTLSDYFLLYTYLVYICHIIILFESFRLNYHLFYSWANFGCSLYYSLINENFTLFNQSHAYNFYSLSIFFYLSEWDSQIVSLLFFYDKITFQYIYDFVLIALFLLIVSLFLGFFSSFYCIFSPLLLLKRWAKSYCTAKCK